MSPYRFRSEFRLHCRKFSAVSWSEEAEVAYAHEAFGKDVLGVPAYELDSGEGHLLVRAFIPVVLVFKGDALVIHGLDSVVADGDSVCVAGDVLQSLVHSADRRLGSKDYVAVKAREPFDICTSMSCLESTGAMHTSLVAYREHPSRLDIDTRSTAASPEAPAPGEAASPFSFSSSSYADGGPSASSPIEFESLVSMQPELFHLGTNGYGIDILCENIFYKDNVLFLLISLKNGSAVSYALSDPRFSVESKRRTKRGLQYEKAIFPKQAYGLGVVQPDATGKMVFTFDKVSLTRGQVFRIYFYEKGGARNYVITLGPVDINRAKRLN